MPVLVFARSVMAVNEDMTRVHHISLHKMDHGTSPHRYVMLSLLQFIPRPDEGIEPGEGKTFSFYQGSIVVVYPLDCDDFIVVFHKRMTNTFHARWKGKRRLLQIYSVKDVTCLV